MYKRIIAVQIFIIGLLWGGARTNSVIYKDEVFHIIHPNEIKEINKPKVYANGILFTYDGSKKDRVGLSGTFIHWQKKINFYTNEYGIFYRFVPLELKQGSYMYRYAVNDLWINDPSQDFYTNDGYGTMISAFYLKKDLINYNKTPKKMGNGYYKFFLKDNNFKSVSWVGTRNNWDPYVDKMKLEGGHWTIVKKIPPDMTYYKFTVDGRTVLDPCNPHITRLKFEEEVNYVKMQ
ncbi:MAG TPA: hypothetical protein VKS21_06075 [Spirochaetota bacterium]|nr:hypothetical protein [Spirochaetota bacterium]